VKGVRGERSRALGLKMGLVLPVNIYLSDKVQEMLSFSPHFHLWAVACLDWAPDGSCGCSEHKRFLVCPRIYQCLNRSGGSPAISAAYRPSFPCTLASHSVTWVYHLQQHQVKNCTARLSCSEVGQGEQVGWVSESV
jgi:hypothetical protein